MLDDINVLSQRDPSGALKVANSECEQVLFKAEIQNADNDHRQITSIVVAGMGGSALASMFAKSWLKSELLVPMEIVRSYDLPAYVTQNTLVVISSYSGNTEETISCFESAKSLGAQVAIIASGGKLIEQATINQIAYITLPSGIQPRMAMIYSLCAFVSILANFGIVTIDKINDLSEKAEWLRMESSNWSSDVATGNNLAKQIAIQSVGKTPIFYSGTLTAPVAYKFKISLNENAKNVAFWNQLPEFNHNEFVGWTSHPVEKPFAIFDVISNLENERILKRFEISDRLLSGKRPKSIAINLAGESLIEQLLWGSILADYVGIYVAILNGVDPTPVQLIEKLKQELA